MLRALANVLRRQKSRASRARLPISTLWSDTIGRSGRRCSTSGGRLVGLVERRRRVVDLTIQTHRRLRLLARRLDVWRIEAENLPEHRIHAVTPCQSCDRGALIPSQ